MTSVEKEKVHYWRGEGLGYKAIAAKVGVSESAVKSYCQRNGIAKGAKSTCRHCGKHIEQQPKRKPRKFCSDACCQAWWNSQAARIEKKTNHKLACNHCGRAFVGQPGRKFCSHPCFIATRFQKGQSP